ncbi:MAG: M48 family metallopeptidase [Cyanobacteriota bacterium]
MAYPQAGSPAQSGTRRVHLKDFPFALIYRSDDQGITIYALAHHWKPRLGVQVNKLFVQAMSRQWGSCNPSTKNIRLNTQLAQKPRACLDYILLHELAHLRVPNHGEDFVALLNSLLPDWEERRRLLNDLPLLDG